MSQAPALRTAATVALCALGLALIGSLIFWQERALYLDAPHILYRIINSNSLQIQEGRIGSFITQGVPLLAARAGLSLKTILILYSLSFPFFYLLSGIVLYRVCRRYDLVILLAGYHLLLCTASWYWTNNEVHQGVTWLLLSWGIVQKLSRAYIIPSLLLFCLGTWLALFTHPLVMIPAISLWGAWTLTGNLPWKRKHWNIAATVVLVAIAIWKFSSSAGSGGYETGKMSNVQKMQPMEVFRSFGGPVALAFYRNLLLSYPGYLILLLAGLYATLRHNRKLLLTWCLLCIIGHLSLLGLTYTSVEAWYIESEWMGFAIPGLALLLYAGRWERWRPMHIGMAGLAIVVVQAAYIGIRSAPFTKRLAVTRQVLDGMRRDGISKAIVPDSTIRLSGDLMVWDAPVQSQILSAMQGDKPQLTFAVAESVGEAEKRALLGKDSAWECFGARAKGDFNPRYFSFDTSAGYRLYALSSGKKP